MAVYSKWGLRNGLKALVIQEMERYIQLQAKERSQNISEQACLVDPEERVCTETIKGHLLLTCQLSSRYLKVNIQLPIKTNSAP